jgi:hypothetical protein
MTTEVAPNFSGLVEHQCPPGKVVLNAGFMATGTVSVWQSIPLDINGWRVIGRGGTEGGLLTLALVCVNGPA